MSITIYANGQVATGTTFTGLHLRQTQEMTLVWPAPDRREIVMPHKRYALSCDNPASAVPGAAQFKADLLANLVGNESTPREL